MGAFPKNRVRMNVLKDPDFDLEEYEFGIPAFDVLTGLDYRLVIVKRAGHDQNKVYYVVSTRALVADMFPKAVPYSYVEEIEDEFDEPAPIDKLMLADSGAYLYENYDDAAEVYRRTAYRMTREIQMAKIRKTASKIRHITCRTCGAEQEWPIDPHDNSRVPSFVGGPMTGVTIPPHMETDSGICQEHFNA